MKAAVLLNHDLVWPRDEEHRFRIYSVNGKAMNVLAAAPDAESVGVALLALHADAREAGLRGLADIGAVGVLDVCASGSDAPGEWVIVPFPKGPFV